MLHGNITFYFHVDSIAKMLTSRRLIMVLQHKESHVKKSLHFQFEKSFDLTKNGEVIKILMSVEIMSMSRDIKLKQT